MVLVLALASGYHVHIGRHIGRQVGSDRGSDDGSDGCISETETETETEAETVTAAGRPGGSTVEDRWIYALCQEVWGCGAVGWGILLRY